MHFACPTKPCFSRNCVNGLQNLRIKRTRHEPKRYPESNIPHTSTHFYGVCVFYPCPSEPSLVFIFCCSLLSWLSLIIKSFRSPSGHFLHNPHGLGVSAESTTLALGVEKVRLEKPSHRQEWTL